LKNLTPEGGKVLKKSSGKGPYVLRTDKIIGEAARLVSAAFRDRHPEIPWQQIIAQRNVIAHDYGEIKQDRIWKVVSDRIPALITRLERLLPAAPTD